jgi:hypothetical protein
MIEFTISRVCMSVCGLVLLAAVIAPVTGMYESKTARMEFDIPGNIASLIDDFHYSKMDALAITMSDILPNSSSYVELNGQKITVTTGRGTYIGGTSVPVTADGVFGYGDIVMLSKQNGTVVAEKAA